MNGAGRRRINRFLKDHAMDRIKPKKRCEEVAILDCIARFIYRTRMSSPITITPSPMQSRMAAPSHRFLGLIPSMAWSFKNRLILRLLAPFIVKSQSAT